MRDKKGEKREKNIIIMVISENELKHAWRQCKSCSNSSTDVAREE